MWCMEVTKAVWDFSNSKTHTASVIQVAPDLSVGWHVVHTPGTRPWVTNLLDYEIQSTSFSLTPQRDQPQPLQSQHPHHTLGPSHWSWKVKQWKSLSVKIKFYLKSLFIPEHRRSIKIESCDQRKNKTITNLFYEMVIWVIVLQINHCHRQIKGAKCFSQNCRKSLIGGGKKIKYSLQ